MAIIKSTLDIVLEKTKHLSFNEDEKRQKEQDDIQKRISVLIQKVKDKAPRGMTAMLKLYGFIGLKNDRGVEKLIIDQLLDALAVDEDNTSVLNLLSDRYQIETGALKAAFDEYKKDITDTETLLAAQMKQAFEEDKNISGPAVVPNPRANPHFPELLSAARKKHMDALDALKADILKTLP